MADSGKQDDVLDDQPSEVDSVAEDFAQYLRRKQTVQSLKELKCHRSVWTALKKSVAPILHQIEEKEQTLLEKRSTTSWAKSNAITDTARMRAKAEAARTALEFAAKEAELKRAEAEMSLRKTNIQTDLELLSKRTEAAVATAECQAVMEESESQRGIDSVHDIHLPKESSMEKTRKYIESTNKLFVQEPVANRRIQASPALSFHSVRTNVNAEIHRNYDNEQRRTIFTDLHQQNTMQSRNTEQPNSATLSKLSRFLLKKDLLMSRFSRFNDRLKSYELWKINFQAIAKELTVSSLEESELLVKYLGPESSKFA